MANNSVWTLIRRPQILYQQPITNDLIPLSQQTLEAGCSSKYDAINGIKKPSNFYELHTKNTSNAIRKQSRGRQTKLSLLTNMFHKRKR